MKLYICLDYEHSTPRYYSKEMNFWGGPQKKSCTRMSGAYLWIEKERKKNPDCCQMGGSWFGY